MKTVTGRCDSSKDVSLSKAAKIIAKFVSADNGASHAINAYLRRASASFNELNQLHKEIKSPHSHKKKHKRRRADNAGDEGGGVVENSVPGVKSEEFRVDSEKSTQTDVKFSRGVDSSVENRTGSAGEKHKKSKKKQGDESLNGEDNGIKLSNGVENEIESGREKGSGIGMEEEKKPKKEKKKHKKGGDFSSNKSGVENLEDGDEKEQERGKQCDGLEGENGGVVRPQDSQIKKKKKKEAGSQNKSYDEATKMEQRRKRKSEDVEGRPEERSEKRMKRKQDDDL
ncbi:hypothetical protein RJT34_08403 [Clitoria ternatea]|uniref:Uncharacterized protein n=1 Tax=Clitoria ternatea TaxID=43366 RepID=A0AAN9K7N8_CLITE